MREWPTERFRVVLRRNFAGWNSRDSVMNSQSWRRMNHFSSPLHQHSLQHFFRRSDPTWHQKDEVIFYQTEICTGQKLRKILHNLLLGTMDTPLDHTNDHSSMKAPDKLKPNCPAENHIQLKAQNIIGMWSDSQQFKDCHLRVAVLEKSFYHNFYMSRVSNWTDRSRISTTSLNGVPASYDRNIHPATQTAIVFVIFWSRGMLIKNGFQLTYIQTNLSEWGIQRRSHHLHCPHRDVILINCTCIVCSLCNISKHMNELQMA